MNFIKKLIDKLFPVPNGKVEAPPLSGELQTPDKVEELQFRVVTFFSGSDYYALECKGKLGWYRVTELWECGDGELDDLHHPILSENFNFLVKMAKGFKDDPASYEAHKQSQIVRYKERKAARAEKVRKHDSRVEYI